MTRKLPVRRVYTGNRANDDAQRAAQDATRMLNRFPLLGGVLLDAEEGQPARTGLEFTMSTPRAIKHGLGRPAVGWIEVYGAELNAATPVGLASLTPLSGTSAATHVSVMPGATSRCFLYVF